MYSVSYNQNEAILFLLYTLFILFCGLFIFFTKYIFIFFFFYESLLIPSFLILYKFAKVDNAKYAAFSMFFWTQFGALFLLILFIYLGIFYNCFIFSNSCVYCFSERESIFLIILLLVGFGVKMPLWPFYSWLPAAHVEASTNFSIFLSGVLVKFAFFAFFRVFFFLNIMCFNGTILIYLLIGLVESCFKLFRQGDLKKAVAYMTVVEMHWLCICLLAGQSCLLYVMFAMIISHAILSTNSFLIVDSIYRRFKTRSIVELQGLFLLAPKLYLVSFINCVLLFGFPCTLFFLAEVFFFLFIIDLFPTVFVIIFFFVFFCMPMLFFRLWLNVWYGISRFSFTKAIVDLTRFERFVFYFNFIFLFILGFFNGILFF